MYTGCIEQTSGSRKVTRLEIFSREKIILFEFTRNMKINNCHTNEDKAFFIVRKKSVLVRIVMRMGMGMGALRMMRRE
jgi:hypothetical protein